MRGLVILALAALLGGCDRSDQCGIPDYSPPKGTDSDAAALAATDMCVSHWARTYAGSWESAGDAADAAIAECAELFHALSYRSSQPNPIVAPQTPAELQQSFRKDAIKAVFHYREKGCRSIFDG